MLRQGVERELSEDGWVSKIRIKEYIDAIMYEEKVIDKTTVHEVEEAVETPAPLIPITGTLYSLRIKCRLKDIGKIIDVLTSSNGRNTFLDELYVKNKGNRANIITLLYTRNSSSIWRLVDELLEIRGVDKVDMLRLKHRTVITPNPLLFPVRLGSEVLSLIPQKVVCRIGDDWALLAEEITRLIEEYSEKKTLDIFLFPRLIYILGLGNVRKEKYGNNKVEFLVGCGSSVSDNYCSLLGLLASRLTGYNTSSKRIDDKSCLLVLSKTP